MKLWRVSESRGSFEAVDRLDGYYAPGAEPRIRCLNEEQIIQTAREIEDHDMADHEVWQRYGLVFRAVPEPILTVTEKDFDLDYFFLLGYDFTSKRLRSALEPFRAALVYRRVDSSSCPLSVRALQYEIVHVLPTSNPFDPERMPGRVRPVRQEDGTLRDEWIVELPDPKPGMVSEIYFRDDFVPPAPIFRAIGTQFTLATDDLAEQVMRAGITDMAFMDISGRQEPGNMILRELR